MADLADIRSGIAALLRTALPSDEGQVSAYLLENPVSPSLAVAGVVEMEANDFTDGRTWNIVVEGVAGLASSVRAGQILDEMLDTVPAAVEADGDGEGALYSRLDLDTGAVTNGHAAAADSVAFVRYEGQTRFTLQSGQIVLLGSWLFRVIT